MADNVPVTQHAQTAKIASPRGSVSSVSTDERHDEQPSNNQSSKRSYDSPRRHHTRKRTARPRVKETLNARSEYTNSVDDGTAEHRINQYLIKQEIGRGSFGAVHLAVDQYGQEYAVKEFSKSRLRKRAQSHVLRHVHGARRPAGVGFNSPLHMHPSGNEERGKNPLYLIQEEIAIMKKLHHNNLVALVEVLDDPTEDSLYMVMEMCKKGVIMKVGLGEDTDPYDDERCRCWFRDLILGIEYLHAQGVVHRDIKPDNCLLTSDDVLKVVDFGVSEMFEKDSAMYTAKSAGSPAFLPPELCVVKHGDISGKAADIWSMGVTLYCLRYGRIPFEKESILELYDCIRNSELNLNGEKDEAFKDLMTKILEKDPNKRIKMPSLRAHPWVTKDNTDPLLPTAENTTSLIGPPTEEEMNTAITRNITHVFAVAKAVRKFKKLIHRSGPMPMESILGEDVESHFVQPPLSIDEPDDLEFTEVTETRKPAPRQPPRKGVSESLDGSVPSPQVGGLSGISTSVRKDALPDSVQYGSRSDSAQPEIAPPVNSSPVTQSPRADTPSKQSISEGTRGHARDPLMEEHAFLFIGPSTFAGDVRSEKVDEHSYDEPSSLSKGGPDPRDVDVDMSTEATPGDASMVPIVSESPGAADIDIYETAYQEEIDRIQNRSRALSAPAPTIYLTRRVEGKQSALANLLRQATKETSLLGKTSATSTVAQDDSPGSSKKMASLTNVTEKMMSATTASTPTETPKAQAIQTESSGGGTACVTNSTTPGPLEATSIPTVTSMPTTAAPATTTASATAAMAPSSPEKSRSGLRNLLDKVRQGR